MKIPNQSQIGEPNLTITPVIYRPYVGGDRALQRKKTTRPKITATSQASCTSSQSDVDDLSDVDALSDAVCRSTKLKVRAFTELITQLPAGAIREVVSESFTAIINGEGDIKHLRALTVSAARQLRTMYLSGGEKALAADSRWAVREYAFNYFGIQLIIGPKGLHLGEGQSVEDFNAFLKIEANGHVWAGETYEDATDGPLTEPLTTEDVLQRLSEKLLRVLY